MNSEITIAEDGERFLCEEPERLCQTTVRDVWFVSTAGRMSSTHYPTFYYETLVWEQDRETNKRGRVVHSQDSGIGIRCAMENHGKVCAKLAEDQSLEDEEE